MSWIDELTAIDRALAQRIASEIDAVRTRWPHAPEPDGEFARMLAAKMTATIHAGDLYLAWWCRDGDPAALAAFEHEFADVLAQTTARFRTLPSDELLQQLRIKLFVGGERAGPRIRDYVGSGPLRGWLRVTAVRTFVDMVRGARRAQYTRELDEADLFGDPRDAHVRPQLSQAIKRAFADAVARLQPRERVFLRHATVERLTLDQIAENYGVHRTTVARTLASARGQLIENTRAAVASEIGVANDELDSAIGVLDSRIDLSLSRVLGRESTD